MKLNSESPLAAELCDPEIRQHTVTSQIKIGVPFQIRAMREHRGWTQTVLAEKLGTTQNTISRLENPRTGKPTITTLIRLAEAFDVGLLVRFVPFGFYKNVIESMDSTHVEVPSYDEELEREAETDHPGQPKLPKGDKTLITQTSTERKQTYGNLIFIDGTEVALNRLDASDSIPLKHYGT
jgi:HTH-type transcriptional regulator / antitoxin HipB